MKMGMLITAGVAAACTAGAAQAATAVVDGLGGPLGIRAGSMPSLFGAASPNFSSAALAGIHAELNGDGIATGGKVTGMLVETGDAGLAWIVLVDDETDPNGFKAVDSSIAFGTQAASDKVEFINDNGGDNVPVQDPGTGFKSVNGGFQWDSDAGKGDGFGWANLSTGDFMTFSFIRIFDQLPTFPGLDAMDTFQFVTWNEGDGEWELASGTGEFTQNNQFSYSVTIAAPLPTGAGLGLAGLAGFGFIRRRRAL